MYEYQCKDCQEKRSWVLPEDQRDDTYDERKERLTRDSIRVMGFNIIDDETANRVHWRRLREGQRPPISRTTEVSTAKTIKTTTKYADGKEVTTTTTTTSSDDKKDNKNYKSSYEHRRAQRQLNQI